MYTTALALIFLLVVTPVLAKYQPPHTMPGPAVDRVLFKGGVPVDVAPNVIENKDVDLYLSSLRTDGARALQDKSDVKVLQVPAGSVDIILNPAPAPAGQLNPFSILEVRFALQYIANRDFVVNEIYKGLAAPMLSHVSPFDYDYLGVSDIIRDSNIRYDPDLAAKLVSDAMTKAGATLQDGQWVYNGSPIRLKFIVRVEDERKDIGDLITAELRKLGFAIDPVFQNFGPAIASVYGTDPSVFEWNLYTEGWGRGNAERYDSTNINQMCAPWLGNLPGWKEVGFWQYENPTIDQIGKMIFMGNFSGVAERNELYGQMTEMCLHESIRLWIATVVNSFPVTSSVQGLSLDSVGGPRSLTTLREAYIPDKPDLTVGTIWVWTARTIWNPVGGFGDVYSLNIWRNLFDPPTWRQPFTGVPSPFRVAYNVETAGPNGKLTVPSDSVLWDPVAGAWRSVGQGAAATSRVVFNYKNYFSSTWHDGQRITMADLFYSIYQTFDLTYKPEKSKVEFAISTVDRPYLDTFRGFKILNDTSIEVYVDYWHFVDDYIAEYASVTSMSTPWEVLAAMDGLVFDQRRLAYSDTAAARFGVDWLSLVEENHARLVKSTLNDFLNKQSFPENVFKVGDKTLAKADDAMNRYRAAMSWFDDRGNMVISNGPFYLKAFDASSQFAEIDAFRDQTYPFKPGDWYFGEPPSIEILAIQGDFIPISKDSQFTIGVRGPGHLTMSYALFDPAKGVTIQKGDAQQATNSSFTLTLPSSLTSTLEPGNYQLFLTASSDSISVIAERTKLLEASTTARSTTVLTTTTGAPGRSQAAPFDSTPLLAALAAVAVILIALVFVRRKRGSRRDTSL